MKWKLAELIAIKEETPSIKSFTFKLPHEMRFFPGQHMDIRLRAEDGYEARRSYSIASDPSNVNHIVLTIDLLPDGEVSGFLHDEARVGDLFEMRGPIGGYFIWKPHFKRPLLLVGGGSGLVPLMSILRTWEKGTDKVPVHLLFSTKTQEDFLFYEELKAMESKESSLSVTTTYTREAPTDWKGNTGRIDGNLLKKSLATISGKPLCYVCGSTALVEFVANKLLEQGIEGALIRTERYG
ncbi:MAG: FAD-binding oxidoreductase [Bacteroidota bacterium]